MGDTNSKSAATPLPEAAPAAQSAASTSDSPLRRLIDIARGKKAPLIHLQHNPDPDALASAEALRVLIRRLFNVDSVLAYTGRVGRVENRAMLRHLAISIRPSYRLNYDDHDLILVVDTHPGAGTCRLPPGVVPDVVIDHHPGVSSLVGIPFPYCDPTFGSTSTMVGALFVDHNIPMDRVLATALTYGIRTDTADLSRGVSSEDERVYEQVYKRSDKQILARIERARVPQTYFVTLARALQQALITDFTVSTYLGTIEHTDLVAEVADLLFRLEGAKWALAAGYHVPPDGESPVLSVSLRSVKSNEPELAAGAVARKISDGQGGGHATFAAAQIPIVGDSSEAEARFETLRESFLKIVRAKKTLTRQLCLPTFDGYDSESAEAIADAPSNGDSGQQNVASASPLPAHVAKPEAT